jgi:hypothetical protein
VYGMSTEVVPVSIVPAPSVQEAPNVPVAPLPISTPGNLGMVRSCFHSAPTIHHPKIIAGA